MYLYSIICVPHRQDCCALFAYETALCDQKDTQSRFAVNAARSIVCVETLVYIASAAAAAECQCRTQHCVCRDGQVERQIGNMSYVSMPHAALCVSRPTSDFPRKIGHGCFNAARSIVCVETQIKSLSCPSVGVFQCRTQHCVCRDRPSTSIIERCFPFQCRTQHCVCRDRQRGGEDSLSARFNAARSIVCVETLCPAALVPRGLRRHFGKTRFFAPFLASADELCPEKWGSHRRCPLCGAGCTVLERRNGGMRLCARAGALSISFSSYLMIAHASFFFNDVFASMQIGR